MRVSTTLPAAVSVADGAYVVFTLAALPNTPLPDDDHSREAYPAAEALVVKEAAEHMVASLPALTAGAGFMVTVMGSDALRPEHWKAPDAVSVRTTEPLAVSAMPGVYTGLSTEAEENNPSPEEDHSSEA